MKRKKKIVTAVVVVALVVFSVFAPVIPTNLNHPINGCFVLSGSAHASVSFFFSGFGEVYNVSCNGFTWNYQNLSCTCSVP